MDDFDDDGWDDLRPDLGDYRETIPEALGTVGIFFIKVLGAILFTLAVVALFAYDIWREWAIFSFLTANA